MRRSGPSSFVLAALAASFFGCASKDYDALLSGVQQNFASIKTYEVQPSLTLPEVGANVDVKASFECPNKMRADVTSPISLTIVCDGKKLSGCAADYNTCLSLPLDSEEGMIPPKSLLNLITPHLSLVSLTDRYNWTVAGSEKVDGVKMVVFDLTRKTQPERPYQAPKAKMWIEEKRGLLTKVEMCDATGLCKGRMLLEDYAQISNIWIPGELRTESGDGATMAIVNVSDMKINLDISDATFVFTPPADAMVLEEIPDMGGGEMPDLLFLD